MTPPVHLPSLVGAPEWPYQPVSHTGMRVLRARRWLRRRAELLRGIEVRGTRRWMALDLWQALGYDPHVFDVFVAEVGFDETWRTLLGEAQVSQEFQGLTNREGGSHGC